MGDYEHLYLEGSRHMHTLGTCHCVGHTTWEAIKIECEVGHGLWRWAGVAVSPS